MAFDPETQSDTYKDAVIMTDRACPKCDYPLRGLRQGGVCPECGTPIAAPRRYERFADTLTDAPMWYISAVAAGCWLLSIAVFGEFAFDLGARIFLAFGLGFGPIAYLFGISCVSLVWSAAAWLVSSKRPRTENIAGDVLLDSRHLRLVVRGFQGFTLFGAAACSLLAVMLANRAPAGGGAKLSDLELAVTIVVVLARMITFLGLVPLCVYLSAMADWAGETDIGGRLRGATWTMVIGLTGTVVLLGLSLLPIGMFKSVTALVALWTELAVWIAVFLAAWSIFGLARSASWAMQNAREVKASNVRRSERRASQEVEREIRAREVPWTGHYDEDGIAMAGEPQEDSASGRHAGQIERMLAEDDPDGDIPMAGDHGTVGGEGSGAVPSRIHHTPGSIGAGRRDPNAPRPEPPRPDDPGL
ncbi:MAG: hypothetical protein AAGI17_03325 [Planctomycetota bacterium]